MNVSEHDIGQLLPVLDLIGVFANAFLGGGLARKHRLDLIGFAALAIFSGLGGGILRDILLQHGTPVALIDSAYLPTALAGGALAYVLHWEWKPMMLLGGFIDALALGCWAAVGSQKALFFGLGWLPAILLGTLTAVGGGMVRDIVVGRVPTIFGGNTLYATCAIIASGVMVVMGTVGFTEWGAIAATVTGAVLCLLARWRGWILPLGLEWRLPTQFRSAPKLLRRAKRKKRGSSE